jgi:transcriptional regulator of acetoin/glycerol metabolism
MQVPGSSDRGNKVHAAAHLGISRSTLYARIRAVASDR